MQSARTSAKPDYRRVVTCATLATITSLCVFSVVANVMATLIGGMTGRPMGQAAHEVRVSLTSSAVACAPARAEGAAAIPLQLI